MCSNVANSPLPTYRACVKRGVPEASAAEGCASSSGMSFMCTHTLNQIDNNKALKWKKPIHTLMKQENTTVAPIFNLLYHLLVPQSLQSRQQFIRFSNHNSSSKNQPCKGQTSRAALSSPPADPRPCPRTTPRAWREFLRSLASGEAARPKSVEKGRRRIRYKHVSHEERTARSHRVTSCEIRANTQHHF